MGNITYEKEKLHLNLARLQKAGHTFEMVVDPDKAIAYRKSEDKEIALSEVLKSEKIFFDAKKGMLVSEEALMAAFETSDLEQAAKIILAEGKIQLTSEYREKLREEKLKRIIDIIHKNCVDPKTHLPHPIVRIENAFAEAKVKVDEQRSAQEQLSDIIKELRVVIPLKFEIKEMSVTIPAEYAAKSYGLITGFGTMLKEEWLNDGSWNVVIEIPGGLETEFYEKVNGFTHGSNEIKVLKIK